MTPPAANGERRAAMIVPGDPDQPTGGYRYDARIAAGLRARGWSVDVTGLEGRFPDADARASGALDDALAAQPDGGVVVVDGLALGGLPDIAIRHADRLALVGLVHHPLADETGLSAGRRERFETLETRALTACRRVVTTSPFTAGRVAGMGVPAGRIDVVEPGVQAAPVAGDADDVAAVRGQRLLCVGSLVPRKGQDVLIDALARLTDRDWRLELVGDRARDAEFARRLEEGVAAQGLSKRVRFVGVRAEAELDADYRAADVLVLPSHYEGYGMVVTEALARGLPLIATDGGALADTVPDDCALRVPAGDVDALAGALARWLDEPALRTTLVKRALAARDALPDWQSAARRFERVLAEAGATTS